jgi:hypothetical protein
MYTFTHVIFHSSKCFGGDTDAEMNRDLTFPLYLHIMHFIYRMHKNPVITFVLSQSTTAQNIAGTPRKTSKHVSFGSLPTVRSSTPDPVESHMSR